MNTQFKIGNKIKYVNTYYKHTFTGEIIGFNNYSFYLVLIDEKFKHYNFGYKSDEYHLIYYNSDKKYLDKSIHVCRGDTLSIFSV